MDFEAFKALFPLKAQITQEIISTAALDKIAHCIGAKTLQSILPKHPDPYDNWTWGAFSGANRIDDHHFTICTLENINMMRVTEPQEVTFILHQ